MCKDVRARPHLVTLFMPKCFKFQWRNKIPNKRLSALCSHHPGRAKGRRGSWWPLVIHAGIDEGRVGS